MQGTKKLNGSRAFDKALGALIRDRRHSLRISRESLANQLGVSRQGLAKWESGERTFPVYALALICEAISVDVGYFVRAAKEQVANESAS